MKNEKLELILLPPRYKEDVTEEKIVRAYSKIFEILLRYKGMST